MKVKNISRNMLIGTSSIWESDFVKNNDCLPMDVFGLEFDLSLWVSMLYHGNEQVKF